MQGGHLGVIPVQMSAAGIVASSARGRTARTAHLEVGMKFDDYQREFYSRYRQFAETVKVILEKAIEASELPRPQSIQKA
jgi:hypothetical protein